MLSPQMSLSAIKGLIRSDGSFAADELFKGKYDNDNISNTVKVADILFLNEEVGESMNLYGFVVSTKIRVFYN